MTGQLTDCKSLPGFASEYYQVIILSRRGSATQINLGGFTRFILRINVFKKSHSSPILSTFDTYKLVVIVRLPSWAQV